MPRQLLLVRHCQSLANAAGRIEGKGDSPLSPVGLEQAQRVGAFVASKQIGAATLVASTLARARATADAIAAACGWIPSHDHRIRECELGWMEDMSYDDLRKHMIEHRLTVLDADVHGGESLDALAERAWSALSEVLAMTQGPLIAVSHGFTIHALVERRFGHRLGLGDIGNGDVIEVWLDGEAAVGPPTRYPLG